MGTLNVEQLVLLSDNQINNDELKTKIKQAIIDDEQILYDQLSELVFVDNPQDRSSLLKKTIQIVREVRQLGGMVTPMTIKTSTFLACDEIKPSE